MDIPSWRVLCKCALGQQALALGSHRKAHPRNLRLTECGLADWMNCTYSMQKGWLTRTALLVGQ